MNRKTNYWSRRALEAAYLMDTAPGWVLVIALSIAMVVGLAVVNASIVMSRWFA